MSSFFTWMKRYFLPCHIFLGIVFLTSGFIVCFLMLLTLIFVWPFNKTLYRKIIYLLAYAHWSQFTFLGQWWANSETRLFLHNAEDRDIIGKEHTIVIMNHKYEIDWLMAWIIAERLTMLGGTKVYGKSALRYMPLLGWAWYFAESIFLHREWQQDRQTLSKSLSYIRDYPDPFWFSLLLFCEGTRFTPTKHAKSVEYARQHNLPPLKHHLQPRNKGFCTSMFLLKGKIKAILDLTIIMAKDSAPPNMMSVLQGKQCKAVIYARRIPLEEIATETDEECAAWLQEHYLYKDEIYDQFVTNGRFEQGVETSIPRRSFDLLMWCFWAVLTGIPTAYLLFCFVMYGSLTLQLIAFLLLLFGTIVVWKLVSMSEIKATSSEYGMKEKQK